MKLHGASYIRQHVISVRYQYPFDRETNIDTLLHRVPRRLHLGLEDRRCRRRFAVDLGDGVAGTYPRHRGLPHRVRSGLKVSTIR